MGERSRPDVGRGQERTQRSVSFWAVVPWLEGPREFRNFETSLQTTCGGSAEMNFEKRREVALALLQKTGIWRSNYKPPILRLLWRIGFDAPPPHFASFFANFILSGVSFGTIWGFVMWFALWSPQGMPFSRAAFAAFLAGLYFGLVMAVYYRYSARKHSLPKWSDIDRISSSVTSVPKQ